MKSGVWSRQSEINSRWNINFDFQLFMIIPIPIALLVAVMLGLFGIVSIAVVIGIVVFALLIILRQNELAVTLIVAIHLYIDYYLGLYLVAGIMATLLLLIFLLVKSPRHSRLQPPALWLWGVLLIVAIFPALRGISFTDGFNYYFNVLCLALIMLWLGASLAYDTLSIRHLFSLLSCFGTFIAAISVIQYTTGVLLFSSPRYDISLLYSSDYALFARSNVHRAGAFFVHPNSNGAFIAMMLCVALGLFVGSSTLRGKVLYFMEMCILLAALLFTYSTESWIATGVGVIALLILVGDRNNYRIWISLIVFSAAILMFVFFPEQLDFLYQHATNPTELPSRMVAWHSGIAVIRAFPLTGLGLGRHVYFQRAYPYQGLSPYPHLDHPHNAFLELTALGGFPVSMVYIILFLFIFWRALRNWILVDVKARSLVGTGIAAAIALTSFSMSDAGWTLPPLLAIGWLILGAVSSPALTNPMYKFFKRPADLIEAEEPDLAN